MPTQPPIVAGDFFLALFLGREKFAAVCARKSADDAGATRKAPPGGGAVEPGIDRLSPATGGSGKPLFGDVPHDSVETKELSPLTVRALGTYGNGGLRMLSPRSGGVAARPGADVLEGDTSHLLHAMPNAPRVGPGQTMFSAATQYEPVTIAEDKNLPVGHLGPHSMGTPKEINPELIDKPQLPPTLFGGAREFVQRNALPIGLGAAGLAGGGLLAYLMHREKKKRQEEEALLAGEPKIAVHVEPGGGPSRAVAATLGRANPLSLLNLVLSARSHHSNLKGDRPEKHRELAAAMDSAGPELKDTVLRLGGTDLVDDLLWKKDRGEGLGWHERIGGRVMQNPRTTVVGKALGVPQTLGGAVVGNLFRGSHYNSAADAASVYGDVPAVTTHELGHAIDFNRPKLVTDKDPARPGFVNRAGRDLYDAAYNVPFANLFHEARANIRSRQALEKGLADNPDKLKDILVQRDRVLPAGYGSYLGGNFGALGGTGGDAIGALGGMAAGKAYGLLRGRARAKAPAGGGAKKEDSVESTEKKADGPTIQGTIDAGKDLLRQHVGNPIGEGITQKLPGSGNFDLGNFLDSNPWAKGLAYGAPIGAGIGLAGGLINRKRKKHLALGDALMGGALGAGAGALAGGAYQMMGASKDKPPPEPEQPVTTAVKPPVNAGGAKTPEDRLTNPQQTVMASKNTINNQRAAAGIHDYAGATAARLRAEGNEAGAAAIENAQRAHGGAAGAFRSEFGDPGLSGYTGRGTTLIERLMGEKPIDPDAYATRRGATTQALDAVRNTAIRAQDTPQTKATALRALAGVGPGGMWAGMPALAQNPQAWEAPPPTPEGGGLPADEGISKSVAAGSALQNSALIGAARGVLGKAVNRGLGRVPTAQNLGKVVQDALAGKAQTPGTGLASRLGQAAAAVGRHAARVNPPLTPQQAGTNPRFLAALTVGANVVPPPSPGTPAPPPLKPADVQKSIANPKPGGAVDPRVLTALDTIVRRGGPNIAPPKTWGDTAKGVLKMPFKGYGPLNPLNLAAGGMAAFGRQVLKNPATTPFEDATGHTPGAAGANAVEAARALVKKAPLVGEKRLDTPDADK